MTFIEKADQLKPKLIHKDKRPVSVVEVVEQVSRFRDVYRQRCTYK